MGSTLESGTGRPSSRGGKLKLRNVFPRGVAITLLVVITFASILPTSFASTKEKATLSVPRNVPRPVKAKPIFAARLQANTLLPDKQ